MPLQSMPAFAGSASSYNKGLPVFYHSNFTLTKTGDTFLDMSSWGKGLVYINGHHLGRYWGIGPQQTLYVPGVWLKKGKNEIVIFEQQNDSKQTVLKTTVEPILKNLKN